jgi:hypothetical protein
MLKNSRVLRDGDGSPTLRVEVCDRKATPTPWQKLRADYLVELVCAAEELYGALSRAWVDPEGHAVIGAQDVARLREHLSKIGVALEALVSYERKEQG